jgi:hypothetical protein
MVCDRQSANPVEYGQLYSKGVYPSPEVATATYTISVFDATQLTLRSISASSITFGTSVVLNVGVTGASQILYELSDGTKRKVYKSLWKLF